MSHPHPELPRRRRSTRSALRVVPLGGLGEIGRNMTVLEYDGRLLIVDCGVLFPEDHQPGVDLILPDFEYIADRLDDIEALVLTHGHEDHIGAVPYLLRVRAGHPARRLAADARAARGQAAGAPDQAAVQHSGREGEREQLRAVRAASSSRSTTRSPTRSPSPSARRPAWCCTPATSRWTSSRSTAASPTCGRSPGSARRASTCSWSTPPTPRCPGFITPEREIGPVLDQVFPAASSGSSSRRSPRTCTACSRCSTPPTRTGARSPSSAGRWCATWASPPTSATSTCRRAC